MKAIAKIDLFNKYKEPRVVEVPLDREERIEAKKAGKKEMVKYVKMPAFFCKQGDCVEIVGDHLDIQIIENKQGERIHTFTYNLSI